MEASKGGLAYLFYEIPVISEISPVSASMHGGSSITVKGLYFLPLGSASCRFGTRSVRADAVYEGGMVCKIPEMEVEGII